MSKPVFTFRNQLDEVITTSDPTTAEKYRAQADLFTEVETAEVPYAKRRKADLEDEVATRNSGRLEADLIQVGGNGTVADLAAALEADDSRDDDRG